VNLLPNEREAHASQARELTRRQRRAISRKNVSRPGTLLPGRERSGTLLQRRVRSRTFLRRRVIDGDPGEFHGHSPATFEGQDQYHPADWAFVRRLPDLGQIGGPPPTRLLLFVDKNASSWPKACRAALTSTGGRPHARTCFAYAKHFFTSSTGLLGPR
jgi:hypothetical protein